MIKKYTLLSVGDNSGLRLIKCIHHYFGSNKQTSYTGDFIKASVRRRRYGSRWVKAKKMYTLRKGKRTRAYIIRTRYKVIKPDGCSFRFNQNSTLTLKKRMTSRAKFTLGPFSYGHGRKKVLDSFPGVL